MLEERVGIVIPSYNGGTLVTEAAHSALACLGSHHNVVVVDDGTTDRGSLDALSALRREGFAVHVQPNGGVSRARNTGLGLLRTPYAFVLDSDDLIEPGAATIAADVLEAFDDVAIVAGSGINFTHSTASAPISPGHLTRDDMWRWTMIATASAFRVRDWAASDGFPDGVAVGEDWVFWLRLLRDGRRIETSDAVFVRHRIHDAQTTRGAIDPREPAKSSNLVMMENPDLILAHPDELLDELGRLRMTLAEYRHAYRHADRVKARLRAFARRGRTET